MGSRLLMGAFEATSATASASGEELELEPEPEPAPAVLVLVLVLVLGPPLLSCLWRCCACLRARDHREFQNFPLCCSSSLHPMKHLSCIQC